MDGFPKSFLLWAMMEVILLFHETLFKCYNLPRRITLMMLVSASQEMMIATPSSNVFFSFFPFHKGNLQLEVDDGSSNGSPHD